MFRKLAAIFFLFAFSGQLFSGTIIIIDYVANTVSFARNCENKSRPALNCIGKCQMMKKLKDEERKDHEYPGRRADIKNEVFSSRSFFTTFCLPGISFTPSYSPPLIHAIPPGSPSEIFHPPGRV